MRPVLYTTPNFTSVIIIANPITESEDIMPNITFNFYCPTCKSKNVEYHMKEGIAECDTPVGTIQTTEDRAYCATCGTQLHSTELRNINYMLMVRATMALWRTQNPNGTKKQCRRALGLTQETVSRFWDNCMQELPQRYDKEDV